MRSARRPDGEVVVFTRQERTLLLALTRKAGLVVTRSELVQSLSQTGRDAGERNVDFLVNKLRGHLGDDARSPRFVATQYGEGYVWIAQEARSTQDAFLVFGPLWGEVEEPLAKEFIDQLQRQLASLLGKSRSVALDRDGTFKGQYQYRLDLVCVGHEDAIHGALTLRAGEGQRSLASTRLTIEQGHALPKAINMARWARSAVWQNIAKPDLTAPIAANDVPLEIRLSQANRALSAPVSRWREGERELKEARQASPNDPTLALLWAFNRLVQSIDWPPGPEMQVPGAIEAVEDEIEQLVLTHLPATEDNPLLKLAAAKMLFFINRGHQELAEQLAAEAFASSTAFAAAYATRAQLLMCAGNLEEALRLYDLGLELAEFGTEFHAYLLILKCTALMAGDRRGELHKTAQELFRAWPEAEKICLFFVAPGLRMTSAQELALASLTLNSARAMISHIYFTSARHFRVLEQKRNVLAGLLAVLREQFPGAELVPKDVLAGLNSF